LTWAHYQTLSNQLKKAGFSSVYQVNPGESSIPLLNDLESNLYKRKNDFELLKFELWHTLSIEAKK
jgi:hypothetical protein